MIKSLEDIKKCAKRLDKCCKDEKYRHEEILKSQKDYKKTGIPKCFICGKPMVNVYDKISKKISKHSWKTTCEHTKDTEFNIG